MISYLKQKYLNWKEKRFLKYHMCVDRAQYERRYDPDYNMRASKVKDYYHGYPYVYRFDDRDHTIYFWDLGYDGRYVIKNWCKANLKDKFRIDFLRVWWNEREQEWEINWWNEREQEWEINSLGGGDYIFIAFKDERDMMWFKLRWEGSRDIYC